MAVGVTAVPDPDLVAVAAVSRGDRLNPAAVLPGSRTGLRTGADTRRGHPQDELAREVDCTGLLGSGRTRAGAAAICRSADPESAARPRSLAGARPVAIDGYEGFQEPG